MPEAPEATFQDLLNDLSPKELARVEALSRGKKVKDKEGNDQLKNGSREDLEAAVMEAVFEGVDDVRASFLGLLAHYEELDQAEASWRSGNDVM